MRKKRKKKYNVERSLIVPIVEKLLYVLGYLSLFKWIALLAKRWKHDELIPFWFAEIYILGFFLPLLIIYTRTPVGGMFWFFGLVIALYRLFDIAQGLASIIVFEPKIRRDEQGGYILARDTTRWLLMTLINLCEIVLYFSFLYLNWGDMFAPEIMTRVEAIYQSASVFIAGSGEAPLTDLARIIVLANLGYFILFLVIIAPMVFSLIRAKERTYEKLGNTKFD